MLGLAPCLRRVLPVEEHSAPVLGTLIFHPSALPYRRGRDAVLHTVRAGKRVSGATWFWCGGERGLDSGPICEQEVVVLQPNETPRQAYAHLFIPAGLRALERALDQEEALATYDRSIRA